MRDLIDVLYEASQNAQENANAAFEKWYADWLQNGGETAGSFNQKRLLKQAYMAGFHIEENISGKVYDPTSTE